MSRTVDDGPIDERWDRLHELDQQRVSAWETYYNTVGSRDKGKVLDRLMKILEEERTILAMPYPLAVGKMRW